MTQVCNFYYYHYYLQNPERDLDLSSRVSWSPYRPPHSFAVCWSGHRKESTDSSGPVKVTICRMGYKVFTSQEHSKIRELQETPDFRLSDLSALQSSRPKKVPHCLFVCLPIYYLEQAQCWTTKLPKPKPDLLSFRKRSTVRHKLTTNRGSLLEG